jgi:endonuclease G, mitochondrial
MGWQRQLTGKRITNYVYFLLTLLNGNKARILAKRMLRYFIILSNKKEIAMKKLAIIFLLALSFVLNAGDYKPIVLSPDYAHDKWNTQPKDHVFKFAAYTLSFDGSDDNNGDDKEDKLGIPEWVSFEIKKLEEDHNLKNRPSWMTDDDLFSKGIAPDDKSYAVSGTRDIKEVKTDYRFVRGHMCPKDTAERISVDAAYNTHTVLNACPQLQWQNNGIWKDLEQKCNAWADQYGSVWVICGPVFFQKNPAMWLGQNGEKKVAIPDAFFKIVAKKNGGELESLAFLIPNILPKEEKTLEDFLTSVDRIEVLTGLDFFTALEDEKEARVEIEAAKEITWTSKN